MKTIGLMPLYDDERESLWMLPGYLNMLEAEGTAPLVLPLTDNEKILDHFLAICDGFLLTGGHDVSPSLYGEETLPVCGACSPLRDQMDCYMLKGAIRLDKPVLGICRGIQLMNACLGGTLYQDLPAQKPSDIEHHMSPPYYRPVHRVDILRDTPLYDILKQSSLGVNSYHHQAVKVLARDCRATAISEDGLIEGLYLPGKRFILGVQWHPEFSYQTDAASRRLIQAFLRA